jgi:hypothetical protein
MTSLTDIFPVDKYTHYALSNFIHEYADHEDIILHSVQNLNDFLLVVGTRPSRCVQSDDFLAKIFAVASPEIVRWIISRNAQDFAERHEQYIIAALNTSAIDYIVEETLNIDHVLVSDLSGLNDVILASGDLHCMDLLKSKGFMFVIGQQNVAIAHHRVIKNIIDLNLYLNATEREIIIRENPHSECIEYLSKYINTFSFRNYLPYIHNDHAKLRAMLKVMKGFSGDHMLALISEFDRFTNPDAQIQVISDYIKCDDEHKIKLQRRLNVAISSGAYEVAKLLINADMQYDRATYVSVSTNAIQRCINDIKDCERNVNVEKIYEYIQEKTGVIDQELLKIYEALKKNYKNHLKK